MISIFIKLLLKNLRLYIPDMLVKMRVRGKSNRSLRNILFQSQEDYKAWRINGLRGRFIVVLLKKLYKVPQFIFIFKP